MRDTEVGVSSEALDPSVCRGRMTSLRQTLLLDTEPHAFLEEDDQTGRNGEDNLRASMLCKIFFAPPGTCGAYATADAMVVKLVALRVR